MNMFFNLLVLALVLSVTFAYEDQYPKHWAESVESSESDEDLAVAETVSAGKKAIGAATVGTKFGKGGAGGAKSGVLATAKLAAKGGKKSGFATGGAKGMAGVAKAVKTGAFGAAGKGFKKGFKKGKYYKIGGTGYHKKFGSIKTFGSTQGFKFGKTGGSFVVGGVAGAVGKKAAKIGVKGMVGFKKGAKAGKGGFTAVVGAKKGVVAKAGGKAGFKKGTVVGAGLKTAKKAGAAKAIIG